MKSTIMSSYINDEYFLIQLPGIFFIFTVKSILTETNFKQIMNYLSPTMFCFYMLNNLLIITREIIYGVLWFLKINYNNGWIFSYVKHKYLVTHFFTVNYLQISFCFMLESFIWWILLINHFLYKISKRLICFTCFVCYKNHHRKFWILFVECKISLLCMISQICPLFAFFLFPF